MSITFQQRIELTLPPWWGYSHQNLSALTFMSAAAYAQTDAQITALKPLIRINTATGEILDLIALDFFGQTLARALGEIDTVFRNRIKANLFVVKGTRPAFIAGIQQLIDAAPIVIDPRAPNDTGVMGNVVLNAVPTVFYNTTRHDCYTNFNMPYQWFTRVTLPTGVTKAQLYQTINTLLPAGTIAWTHTE